MYVLANKKPTELHEEKVSHLRTTRFGGNRRATVGGVELG
jgi:hypothetical protein